jgi:hypothetical protein
MAIEATENRTDRCATPTGLRPLEVRLLTGRRRSPSDRHKGMFPNLDKCFGLNVRNRLSEVYERFGL